MNLKFKLVTSSFVALFFTSLAVGGVSAADYFVSNSGSDSNSGGWASPFQTISKGISVLAPGDTLSIVKGNYPSFTINKSGTASLPITIIGNGSVISGGQNAINVTGSYLDISGFEAKDSVSHGIVISGKNINFSDFSVHDTVNENKSGSSCTGSGGWGSGFKVYVGGENLNISNGQIFHNWGEGLAVTRGINVTVTNVVSYDNFSANIYLDNSKNVTLSRSFVYCTDNSSYYRSGQPASGILIGEENYSGWGAQLENLKIVNNIIFACRGLSFYGAEVSPGGLVGALIAHNTISSVYNNGRAISIAAEANNSKIVIKNNIVDGAVTTGTGITVSNNLMDVAFVGNPGTNPNLFKLPNGSNAINAGAQVGVTNDFEGKARDNYPDVGAFEYGGSVVVPTATAVVVPTITPIPFLPSDLNRDGNVNHLDYQIFVGDFGKTTQTLSDINSNGVVDIFDYNIMVYEYGKSSL